MRRFLATVLVVIMLLGMIPTASVAATQYASVVGGWLRLRAGASFESDTITSYYTGTVVEILGNTGKWYHVKTPDSRTGYMYGDYLKLGAVSAPSANAYVTSHNGYGVRMRKGPGTGYRVIATYAVGTPVTILESGTYWSRISINGTTGYMMSQFLTTGSAAGNGNETVLCYATIWSSNGYGVRLRTGPSTGYGKIGVYSVGTSVAVLEKGETWDRIRVGSRTGWMMNDFLIYQNAYEVTSVTLNTYQPKVGDVMYAQAMSPSSATVSYEWQVGGVAKSNNSTYTVTSSDVGKCIQLKITGAGSYKGTVYSAATSQVISNTQLSGLTLNTTAPVVGDVIKATIAPEGATVAYAWQVAGYQVSNQAEYTVTAADVGKNITLVVTGTGSYTGTLAAATSAVAASSTLTSVSIRNDSNSTAGVAPMVGDTLTAVISPAQATATYQWKRGSNAITGATGASYTLTASDLGAQISVTVTGTGAYAGEKSASLSQAVVASPEKPTIDDYALPDAQVGKTYATQLTAQGGGDIVWTLADGSLPTGITLSATGALTGTPEAEGTFEFKVKAANSAGSDEKTFSIVVAAAAKPVLTVGSITIPSQTEGYAQPAPIAVSITNTGSADAALQQLTAEGTNGDSFVVNENGSTTIAAGATDTSWTVQPKAGLTAGTYTAVFTVLYDGGEKATANISFTVNAASSEEQPPVPVYTITVVGGTADVTASEYGKTISITANAPAEGKVFSSWTSSDVSFADANAATTTFVMPDGNVTVTANYADVFAPVPELQMEPIVLPSLETGYVQPAPYAIEISNVGTGDATLTLLYPQGGSAANFMVNEDGSSTIAAGATNTTWTIQPVAGLAAGVYETEFVVEYNGKQAKTSVKFTVTDPAPVSYQLTVEGGNGSGSYLEGDSVSISANAPADGMLFDKWTVSAGFVADASAASTTFTMPAGDAVVTAVYKAKPQLAAPTGLTWADDGTSVSWDAVPGATEYEYYRAKVGGDTTSKKTTTSTSYTFSQPGVTGDVFYVRAIDGSGNYLSSEYADATY